jgi:signal transduction histidine kinase
MRWSRGVVDNLKHRIDELGMACGRVVDAGITSDRLAIEQILSNLVENAIKYLKPGRPGEIEVRSRPWPGRS